MSAVPAEMLARKQPLLLPKTPNALSSLDNSRARKDAVSSRNRPSVENDENAKSVKEAVYMHYNKMPPAPAPTTKVADRPTNSVNTCLPKNRDTVIGNQEYSFVTHSFTKVNERLQVNRHIDHPKTGGKTFFTAMKYASPAPRRTRMTTEQLRLMSRRIDPTQPLKKPPLPVLYCPSPRQRSQPRRKTSSLQQVADRHKRGSGSIDKSKYNHVKRLSEVLKVRLALAKYRMIEKMETEGNTVDNELYDLLKAKESSSWPNHSQQERPVRFPAERQRSSTFLTTVGNGKNIFKHTHRPRNERSQPKLNALRGLENRAVLPSSRTSLSVSLEMRNGMQPRKDGYNQEGVITPAHRSSLSLHKPVKDFVCKACNRSYKTKNGLQYHMNRCKFYNSHIDNIHEIYNNSINNITSTSTTDAAAAAIAAAIAGTANMTSAIPTPAAILDAADSSIETIEKSIINNIGSIQDTNIHNESKEEDDDAVINCICDASNEEDGTMVQCDICCSWLHVACVGMQEDELDDDYKCPRCLREGRGGKVKPPEFNMQTEQHVNDDDEMEIEYAITKPEDDEIQDGNNNRNDENMDATEADAAEQVPLFHHVEDTDQSPWPQPGDTTDFDGYSAAIPDASWSISETSLPSLLFSDNGVGSSLLEDDVNDRTPSSVLSQFNYLGTENDEQWKKYADFEHDFIC